MSDATKQAFEAALEAHIADECDGDRAGAWVLIAETTTLSDIDDDQCAYYLDARNNQSLFMTIGLTTKALENL